MTADKCELLDCLGDPFDPHAVRMGEANQASRTEAKTGDDVFVGAC